MLEKFKETCKIYNKYRAPEARAEILEVEDEKARIGFTGNFCYSCGFYDYLEDFIIFFQDLFGKKLEIKEVEEIENGAIATFSLT